MRPEMKVACQPYLRMVEHEAQKYLTFFAIEHVANRFSPGCVHLDHASALIGFHRLFLRAIARFRSAAFRTTIGKARLVRLQLKLFSANYASFDRKRHSNSL